MLPSINSVILPRGRGQKLYEHPVHIYIYIYIYIITGNHMLPILGRLAHSRAYLGELSKYVRVKRVWKRKLII